MSEQKKSKRWFSTVKKLHKARAPKILLWGAWGTGKTHFLGTCPPPIYIFDPELGSEAVMWHNFKELVDNDEIFIAEIGVVDPATHEIIPEKTLNNLEEAMRELLPEVEDRGTLAIDSGTVAWQVLGWWLDDLKDKKQVKLTKSGQMMRTEWSRANKRFYNWVMQLVNKKQLTVVITSHTQDKYDERGNMVKADAKMRINKQTPYWVDFVYNLTYKMDLVTKEKTRVAILEKCRYADILQFSTEQRQVQDLTYPRMIEHLQQLGLIFNPDGTIDKPKEKRMISSWKT